MRTPGGLSIPPSCYLLNARPRALAYRLNQIASVVGSPQFSADDQVKARAGSNLKYSTFTGHQWAGDLDQLTPGIGYEFKVAQAVTFCYGDLCGTTN